MPKINNTSDLRRMLVAVIDEVRTDKVDVSQARAIAMLTTQILASAKFDLEVARFGASSKAVGDSAISTPLFLSDGKSPPKLKH